MASSRDRLWSSVQAASVDSRMLACHPWKCTYASELQIVTRGNDLRTREQKAEDDSLINSTYFYPCLGRVSLHFKLAPTHTKRLLKTLLICSTDCPEPMRASTVRVDRSSRPSTKYPNSSTVPRSLCRCSEHQPSLTMPLFSPLWYRWKQRQAVRAVGKCADTASQSKPWYREQSLAPHALQRAPRGHLGSHISSQRE